MLARSILSRRVLVGLPSTSSSWSSLICLRGPATTISGYGNQRGTRRVSDIAGRTETPAWLQAFVQYGNDCNGTQALQWSMQSLSHLGGLDLTLSIAISAVALRLVSMPVHFYAEKLFAENFHAQRVLLPGIVKKLATRSNLPVIFKEDGKCVMQVTDRATAVRVQSQLAKIESEARWTVHDWLCERRLNTMRITCLRCAQVPVWFFASFALRNLITTNASALPSGCLWIADITQADPVLPVVFCVFMLANILVNARTAQALTAHGERVRERERVAVIAKYTTNVVLVLFTLALTRIMFQLPAGLSLFWTLTAATGLMQTLASRSPNVKRILRIKSLPTDSFYPWTRAFWSRGK